jgi:hypothetical protein
MNPAPIMDSLNGGPLRQFLPEEEITPEMRDPDYGLKQLEKINNGRYNIGIGCSKCHHCR